MAQLSQSLILIYFVASFSVYVKSQLAEGQACFHKRSKSPGTCKNLDNCIEAQLNLLERDIIPQICMYLSNKKEIVCCRNNETESSPPEVQIESRLLDSRHMCREYAKSVYTFESAFNAPGAQPQNHSQCGFVYRPLIYGGEKAKGKEFPHMALIGYDSKDDDGNSVRKWGCGGSLISDQWVLTAAHCIDNFLLGEAKYVRLGELDYENDKDDAKPEDFNIIKKLKNPSYKDTNYDDIGLLKLHKKVTFNAFIRPACLWPETEIKDSRAIVTGWGSTNDVHIEKRVSHLKLATLSIVPGSECKPYFQNRFRLEQGIKTDTQLCAGARKDEENKDSCQGDSGGPIQVYAKDIECTYYIIGVTAFGKPCGLARAPGVYTRIAPYLTWIENTVWRNK